MGLLLSVLVVCVGVLEVIACVRHLQDGYLPLWTPHCAVTSGYAKTHERWRKKPSDNDEFRSTNDVSGALNHAQDQSSETFLQPSVSVENGYTVKHEFEDTRQEVTPSKEVHQIIDDTFSFENENRIEDLHETDIVSSTLGTEESNLDLISTYDNELNQSPDEHDERKEITTNYINPNLISELAAEHSDSIDYQFEALLNTSDGNVPLSYYSEGNKLDLSSNDGSGQVSLSNKDSGFENRAEDISNILSENQTIAEVYKVHKISGEETFPPGILNNPETFKRFEYDFDRPIESIEDSSDQKESNKLSVFQEEIPQIPSIEEPSQNVQIFSSEVPSGAPKEPLVVDRVADENSELDIDLTSQHLTTLMNNNDSVEECPYVPLSDIGSKNEIASNILHKQSLENTYISNSVTYVPESESEILETEIQEEQNTSLQTKIDSSYDNERPESIDVEEVIQHSRESTPQIFQEYVPLKIDQMKSEIATVQTSEGLEDRNVAGNKPEYPIENSQNTSDISIIAETSIFQSENRPQQELKEISKYDAFETHHDNEENEYIQDDRESTPQPCLEEDNEEIKKIETILSLQKDESEIQREISSHSPEPVSLPMEGEETIKINEKKDTSESRLENQTTSTEFVTPKKENTEESQILVPKSEIPKEIHKPRATTPLTIDTSEESPPNSRQTSHQSSMSPPQHPSTPTKKSKADISWPTFFPGAPVIKRPSVSFATPEAIFTNEDQDLLRQYAEEVTDITPCIKKSEEIPSVADTEDKTPSSAEDKSLESVEASERSDSFEEDIVPITFKERSPSNIVAGNDFSRKELQLQRKKSFKHKRYSSASELNTKEEETEDRSFSENRPSIVRASSLKESRRRYRNPAKASSFEDAMLLEISKKRTEDNTLKKTGDASTIPVIEEKEIESQRDRVVSFDIVAKDDIEKWGDLQQESNQRNESNASNLQYEEIKEESNLEPGSRNEEDEEREGESSYTASEEQSSSQQKSPAKEAFWVSRGDDESD